jgi:hypothetical protein
LFVKCCVAVLTKSSNAVQLFNYKPEKNELPYFGDGLTVSEDMFKVGIWN